MDSGGLMIAAGAVLCALFGGLGGTAISTLGIQISR